MKRLVLLLTLVVAVAAAGCGGTQQPAAPAKPETPAKPAQPPVAELVAARGSYPTTFDPAIGVGGGHLCLFANTYEALLEYKLGTAELVPCLAEQYKLETPTSYLFTLRKGVKFHDGTVLDAEAVKASLDRVMSLGMGPAVFLNAVKNVEVVNAQTVRINLKEPSYTFLYGLPCVFIHGTARTKDADGGKGWFASNINGTGPFKIGRVQQGELIVLDRFADYWRGWPEGSLTRVNLKVVPEPSTQKMMLERGEAHIVSFYPIGPDGPPSNYEKISGLKVVSSPCFRTLILAMNTQKKNPLKDPRVRQAVAYAFDYEAMKQIYFGVGQAPNGFLPPGFPAHNASRPAFKQDLAKAKDLLAKAGYPNGGFTLKFAHAATEEQARKMGLMMQDALKQLNIKVDLLPINSWSQFEEMLKSPETAPDIGPTRLMSPRTGDAGAYLRQMFGSASAGKPYNDSWYQNPQVDKLLDAADKEPDEAKRIKLWQQAEDIIVKDQPVIFCIFANPIVEPVSAKMGNYLFHPLDYSAIWHFYPVKLSK
jgi:peptide/nickel transport system substrate-binding protein